MTVLGALAYAELAATMPKAGGQYVCLGKWLQNVFTVAKIGSLSALILVGLLVTSNSGIWQANFADTWHNIITTDAYRDAQKLVPGAGWVTIGLMVMGGAMVGALFS